MPSGWRSSTRCWPITSRGQGSPEKAVKYLHLAGERAVRLSANEEAIAHFNRAWSCCRPFPNRRERDEQELALQLALCSLP